MRHDGGLEVFVLASIALFKDLLLLLFIYTSILDIVCLMKSQINIELLNYLNIKLFLFYHLLFRVTDQGYDAGKIYVCVTERSRVTLAHLRTT